MRCTRVTLSDPWLAGYSRHVFRAQGDEPMERTLLLGFLSTSGWSQTHLTISNEFPFFCFASGILTLQAAQHSPYPLSLRT